MKINGWDISEADARQWNVTPGFLLVSNDSEWSRGSPVPVLIRNEIGFKTLKVVLLIKTAGGRQAILSRCSEILSRLLDPVELVLDRFNHKFYGILTKHSHTERAINRWHTLTLEFSGYEFDEEQTHSVSGREEFVVDNPGNIRTPVIVEITPQVGVASITLSGLCRDVGTGEDTPVNIRELVTGKTVVIDGETGLITQDGALKGSDVDIWQLPTLQRGRNTITINSHWMDVTIRFRPRFM